LIILLWFVLLCFISIHFKAGRHFSTNRECNYARSFTLTSKSQFWLRLY